MTHLLCVGGALDGKWLEYNGAIYQAQVPVKIPLVPVKNAEVIAAVKMPTMLYRKLHWEDKKGNLQQVWIPHDSDDLDAIKKLIKNYKKSPNEITPGMRRKIDSVKKEVEYLMEMTPAPLKNHLHDVIDIQNKMIEELLKMIVKS